ncbi:uncharacterized protein LOC130405973 isoform X6 [Gadus chalcogrammus]|uniref:uncharacterized protein LOC130405973 isoform X6 n=1 Tax=Gadus chalcogrammus TaxID=1042646 RepID=UPI0024C48940|nr:uncharacterized protein LOC130405973 isoform X6 [Gadus chalcogrammus]
MLINMSPSGSTLEEQLSSIMEVLAKAAVSEISQLFSEGSASLRLQVTRSLKENETLRTRMKGMRSELLFLRLQTRSNASRAASRFGLARAHICQPRTKQLGNEDCDAFGDRSMQPGATSESLHVDAPGSSQMSSHMEELRILSVHGQGEGPLALDSHDTLFTASEVEALNSLSVDHSVATSLCAERLVRHEELSVQQQTLDTISIKVEEDIGGGMPAVGSPTGAVVLSKLKEENRMAKQKIEHLEERLKIYEEANKELKRDFLLSRLRGAEDEAAVSEKPGPSQSTGQLILSPSSSPEPSASSDGPSSSEEGEEKKKTKKKKKKAKKSKETEACSRSRMTTSEGVIGRYMKVLKHYAKKTAMPMRP